MRIWDVPPNELCRSHLLGEHREMHAVWNILTQGKTGYSNHPETKRWVGRLKALYNRHEEIVKEMKARGYGHNTSMDPVLATGSPVQDVFVDDIKRQREILKAKDCLCPN